MLFEKGKEVHCLSVLINFAKRFEEEGVNEEAVLNYFKDNYYFNDTDSIEFQTYKLINNFITLTSDIFKDLNEINNNLKESHNILNNNNGKDSYHEEKKQRYFIRINEEAKDVKEEILYYEVLSQLKERMKNNRSGLEDISKLEKILSDNYTLASKWYNPNYDFDVLVKFFNPLDPNSNEVPRLIELKKTNKVEYYKYIKKYIEENKVLEYIKHSVENHYLLNNKQEIFDILVGLFVNEKYQTFVSLGAIQVEGLFYEFCSAINGGERKDEEGTLINKLKKIFKDNKMQEKIYYPYFAFEVPKYRNEVAHNGFVTNENIEFLSLDIIMDIYTIIKLMKRSNLPFDNVYSLIFFLKINANIEQYTYDNYSKILYELTGVYLMNSDGVGTYSVYNIIKNSETYKSILSQYKLFKSDNSYLIVYDEVVKLKELFEDGAFWGYLLDLITNQGFDNDFSLNFFKKLVNEFIAYLKPNSEAKNKCIEINKLLAQKACR